MHMHIKIMNKSLLGMVAHVFNPSTLEVEEDGSFMSLSTMWSTKYIPNQPGLYGEILFQRNKINSKIDYFVFLYALWV